MNPVSSDRRQHVRRPLSAAVRLYHGPSGREFPARSVDISEGGMLIYVPASTPVSAGQSVRLEFANPAQPLTPAAVRQAIVVHVGRDRMLTIGHLPVGLAFE